MASGRGALRRVGIAVGALVAVTLGSVGYVLLGFPVLEALYQTVTTLADHTLHEAGISSARARTVDAKAKLVLGGANRAVNPQLIGGRRMAAFALHPDVAEFLDVVLHDEEVDYRIEQVRVPEGSALAGRSIGDIDVTGRSGAQLLAARRPQQGAFVPNPPATMVVEAGSTLIGFSDPRQALALHGLVGPKAQPLETKEPQA